MSIAYEVRSDHKALYNGRTLKEWIPDIVTALVAEVDPVQIYVFGSVVRDEDGPDSDLDILVVFDRIENDQLWSMKSKAGVATAGYVPRDVLVTDLARFEFNKQRLWHIEHEVAESGQLVYSREPRIPKEMYMNPPPVDNDADAGYWLERAKRDSKASNHHQVNDQPLALYLAQQAAEKALKALIISDGIGCPKTHDLSELAKALPAGHSDRFNTDLFNLKNLNDLTKWEVEGRYPAIVDNFSDDDAERLFATSGHILETVESIIGKS
ncbi:MAG: HEPN domain-containing protein [Actinobacteria bacterium]|nr:HEPN domain-containing protein [Actinomycetota bacterium]